jgi:hypothetical protein
MPDPKTVAALARAFLDPTDGPALKSFEPILQLLECSPNPFSRHQFTPGHVTASALVLAPDSVRVLTVHHRRLGRWLLPGGHVEPDDDTIAGSARREVIEEPGAMPENSQPRTMSWIAGIPFNSFPSRPRGIR